MTAARADDAAARAWEDRVFWGPPDTGQNVGTAERWVSGALGVAVLAYALGRQRMRLVLVPIGLGLVRRAVTGHCEVKRALLELRARRKPGARFGPGASRKMEQGVTIGRSAAELFAFWRHFENLPRFMDNLESITVLDERRSRWVAKGPLGTRVEWDAEIQREIPDELIAWRSVPGAEVEQSGLVQFTPAPGGGTDVRVVLQYAAPRGSAGDALAHVLGDDPDRQIADDLRRFKQVVDVEAGAPMLAGSSL